MPSNRFDTSVQQQYVSQYVPMPFEAIGALGAQTQKAHDAAIDDTYKLKDLMTKVPAIYDPNLGLSNIQKKKELDAQFAPKIDELANKIYQGDPNAIRELEQVKRDFANNPVRQELEESYLNYKTYKEDAAKKGDAYAIYKDPYRNKALVSETGELQPFRYSGMGEKQDHASEARAQMADIAKMGYDSKNSYLDPNDGNIYTKDSHGKYVKDTRVKNLANQKAVDFSNTQKGQDYLQLLQYQNPNATPQELMQGVSNYLFNAGANQIFSDIGGGTGVRTTGLSIGRDEENRAAQIITTNEQGNPETLNIQNAIDNFGLSDVLDAKGGMITSALDKTGSVTKGGIVTNIKPAKSLKQLALDNATKLVNLSTKLNLGKPEDGDYQKQVYNYITQIAKRASTTSKLQQSTMEGINKAMFGPNSDISNMEFYNQGDESSNAKVTNEAVNSMAKNSRVTGIDYFGPKQAGWKVAVTPKDDSSKNTGVDTPLIGVPRDKGFEEDTRSVHNISRGVLEFARTGKINNTYVNQDVKNKLQTKLNQDYISLGYGKAPELVATSMEKNRYGDMVMMGTYVDNSTGTPDFKAVVYTLTKDGKTEFKETSLDAVQAQKTTELQAKGSLKQYNTKFTETVKPSEVEESED